MPTYHYKARDEEGRMISGSVDVVGEEELQKRLESSGFFLVKISKEKRSIFNEDIEKKLQRISLRDLYSITIQLGNTISTGVPLLASLDTIADSCRNQKLSSILSSVADDLRGGSSLSQALRRHPRVFSQFYTSMVELGESAGSLAKILNSLAGYIKKDMEIRQKILSALMYPVVLGVIGSGIVVYLLIHIMPQFVEIFAEEKAALPVPTLILLTVSNVLTKYWYMVLAVVAAAFMGFRLFIQNEFGRLTVDRLKLRIPILGNVFKKISAKRFIDGLYVLYGSGFPLLGALNIVKTMLSNRHL
ncbi:type II secretion system F family protein, partial [Thermoproteota archaeon]